MGARSGHEETWSRIEETGARIYSGGPMIFGARVGWMRDEFGSLDPRFE